MLMWYCVHEDFYCFTSAAKTFLPGKWRHIDLSFRKALMVGLIQVDDKNFKAQRLDYLWAAMFSIVPDLSDVLAAVNHLKTIDEPNRTDTASQLLTQLQVFHSKFNNFLQAKEVVDILATTPHYTPIPDFPRHYECCPPVPFKPIYFQYPPAGHLRMVCLCIEIYMHSILYPLLNDIVQPNSPRTSHFEKVGQCALELCRVYAGMEATLSENEDSLLPCFSALVTAGFGCPSEVRMWLWYKLAHFEHLGPLAFEPIKKNLSVYWNMPNLAKEGFGTWKRDPPGPKISDITADMIALASSLAEVNLDD